MLNNLTFRYNNAVSSITQVKLYMIDNFLHLKSNQESILYYIRLGCRSMVISIWDSTATLLIIYIRRRDLHVYNDFKINRKGLIEKYKMSFS
jgi:hypothetical protein